MQRAYRIDSIDQLCRQHVRRATADERLRRMDDVERAVAELDPRHDYAVDRVVAKIGCRGWVAPERSKAPGSDLIHDLRLLVEDLSDSVDLPADAVGEQVLTVEDLAQAIQRLDQDDRPLARGGPRQPQVGVRRPQAGRASSAAASIGSSGRIRTASSVAAASASSPRRSGTT